MAMYRVKTIVTGIQGAPGLSQFHFDTLTGSAQQATDAAAAFWQVLVGSLASPVQFNSEAEVDLVDEVTGLLVGTQVVNPFSKLGDELDGKLPWATQGLVRWLTGGIVNGKRVRGATFIPGFTEGNNDLDGTPSATAIANMNGAAQALEDALNAAPVIWSRPTPGRVGTMHPITGHSAGLDWAILRSRRD